MNKFLQILLLVTVPFLTGCISNGYKYSVIPSGETLAKQHKVDVIHITQNDSFSCATTSIAMAIAYLSGRNDTQINQDTVWALADSNIDTIQQQGNDMRALQRITDYYGIKSEYKNRMSLYELEYLLSHDILVAINIMAYDHGNETHMVLVTGYNSETKLLYVNDPAHSGDSSDAISFGELPTKWKAWLSDPPGMSVRSGFIIYPKGN